ncbi:MAG: EVE domain-containing protein, partial [Alsobacter sp.]
MAHWLYKSEPDVWSWQQQVEAGAKGTHWNGVRNHSAKLNLMAMKKGDRGFFYHSNEGKEIVGIVEVIREAYPDHTAEPGSPWVMVDIKAVKPLKRPVTLAQVKAEPRLAKMALVTSMRLSVQPVTDAEWAVV